MRMKGGHTDKNKKKTRQGFLAINWNSKKRKAESLKLTANKKAKIYYH